VPKSGTGGDAHHLSSGRDFVFNTVGGLFSFRSISSLSSLASHTDQLVISPNGNATLRGTLTQNSDVRWKKRIATLENALETILNLRGVTFAWKDTGREQGRQIGFIAQQVEKVLPELVATDENGYKSVAYANIVPVLVEAMKTQQKEIHALEAELKDRDRQQARIERLEAQLAALLAACEPGKR